MSINRGMDKQSYIHMMKYHSIKRDALIYTITWINLLNGMQSERSFADHMLCDSRIR